MAGSEARLGLVILAVRDLPAAVRFYREVFAWSQTVDVPVFSEFQLPGGVRVGLYERESFGRNTGRVPHATPSGELAPTELYFYVDDPEASIRKAMNAGGKLLSPLAPRGWGDEAGYCTDLDGNVLVFARPGRAG